MDFLSQWLTRFGLSRSGWREEIPQHVVGLPFFSHHRSLPLLDFLFADVPSIVASCDDPETRLLSDAFAWCCFAFWQCESAFPALPEDYAEHLRTALKTAPGERNANVVLLARVIVEFNAEEGRCGFNKLKLANPKAIAESERLNYEGRYEVYLKAQEKYDEYAYYLEQSAEFQAEWEAIKSAFPKRCIGWNMIRRSPIPERNWHRGPAASFSTEKEQFQAVFDFFCWKYFLWGMEGDKPLLLKTSVVVTPHGTQIFIPGYLSSDLRRDLNLPEIMKLHKARGVSRQGPGYSTGRREMAELKRKAKAADAEARSLGLKGAARYTYICDAVNYRDHDDFRRIRRLLEEPDRKKQKKTTE